MAIPATCPISAKDAKAAFWSPGRLPSAQLVDDGFETGDHRLEAQVQVVGIGRKGDGIQDDALDVGVGKAVSFHAGVVSTVELAIDHAADAAAGSEGVADEVAEALGAAVAGQFFIYFGKGATQGLSKGEEVSVIVDVYRNAENFVEVRSQGHAIPERGKVGQVAADDAGRIVCRTGEGEADGNGLHRAQLVDDGFETGDHRLEAH